MSIVNSWVSLIFPLLDSSHNSSDSKLLACVPIFPRRLHKTFPMKPLHPNTVHTMPLKELRPPVPLFRLAVVGFLMILGCVLHSR
ncbi:hypothetical protein WN55_11388 [Dufourea novaeangliae]|uniref:Uncharacterized protein n=1 Tax=Dufourea novaeangliae TaxID=178035 RepID=A0A154PAG1_DUFNO|nr:hypothetical protein WN55_11388 [Dufourea novaeangliae]